MCVLLLSAERIRMAAACSWDFKLAVSGDESARDKLAAKIDIQNFSRNVSLVKYLCDMIKTNDAEL